jgi:hypothetical protein
LLKYPLEIQSGQDYVLITHQRYRTNKAIAGQKDIVAPDAAAPPEGSPIVLYMPNSTPSVSNTNSWSQQNSVGPLGDITRALAVGATGGVMGVGKDGPVAAAKGIADQVKNLFDNYKGVDSIRQVAIGKLAQMAGLSGAGALTQLQLGQVYNPNVELLYDSPALRGFTLDFLFVPKNQAEATMMNQIILELKKFSAPDDNGTMFEVPHLWNVTYKSGVNNDKFMNKFKKCALTDVQIVHNPGTDMHSTFADGTPLVTAMSLGFMEVDIIIRKDHEDVGGQGY